MVLAQGAFQIVDTSLMFSPITKWSKQVCAAAVRGGVCRLLLCRGRRHQAAQSWVHGCTGQRRPPPVSAACGCGAGHWLADWLTV